MSDPYQRVEECAYETCYCDGPCEDTLWYWNINGDLVLAPHPNGTCYCGKKRENCPNFETYGYDCNGFKHIDHVKK